MKYLGIFCLLFTFSQVFAQNVSKVPPHSAVFLLIAPDSRSGAMGDAGVAISSDANAAFWNPAKLAFTDKQFSFSLSHSPWLQNLVPDMTLSYLSAYRRMTKRIVAGASLRYFNLGSLQVTNNVGQTLQNFGPREFAFDVNLSIQLSTNFSMGVAGRFMQSNLSGNINNGQTGINGSSPANAICADLSAYYHKDIFIANIKTKLAFGANISNIGTKIVYTTLNNADFLPTNFKIGTALTFDIDEYNKFTFALDANKLLVPSPPTYSNNGQIIAGTDPKNTGALNAMVSSFYDAPGGFKEEISEINYCTGIEYWYKELFALRSGYFYEAPDKGNRQYFTLGIGLRYNTFGIDFSYLVPQTNNTPLANTLRFSLMFNFEKKKKSDKTEETPANN